jgi:glycosyltransferase involved in cell wall biosynthesis
MITGLGYSFLGRGIKSKLLQFVVCILYRVALKKNKNVFFQNPDDLELFVDRKLVRYEQAVLIAGSGINLNQFTVTKIFTKPAIFLLVARLLKDKGILEYVEAARHIKAKYPKAVFQLLGPFDNNPSSISKSKILEWDHEGVIDYLGETKDVRPFISKSNIFVLPSYREGTPRSTLEAMAMGRPVITTDVPGCRETVINGQNGFLVPSKNIESLVKAMEYFLINFESIPQMGTNSRKLVELKFNVHKVNMIIIRAIKTSNS